jgi:hypothetical protein
MNPIERKKLNKVLLNGQKPQLENKQYFTDCYTVQNFLG